MCANAGYGIRGVPSELELLRNAEFRAARLTQMRMTGSLLNPGLAEAVGLTAEEAGQLFGLMAANGLNGVAEFMQLPKSEVSRSLTDASRRIGAGQEGAIRDLLGSAGYARLQQYPRDVRSVLTQVADMGRALASAGKPLTDLQSRTLQAAVLAEQQNQMREESMR